MKPNPLRLGQQTSLQSTDRRPVKLPLALNLINQQSIQSLNKQQDPIKSPALLGLKPQKFSIQSRSDTANYLGFKNAQHSTNPGFESKPKISPLNLNLALQKSNATPHEDLRQDKRFFAGPKLNPIILQDSQFQNPLQLQESEAEKGDQKLLNLINSKLQSQKTRIELGGQVSFDAKPEESSIAVQQGSFLRQRDQPPTPTLNLNQMLSQSLTPGVVPKAAPSAKIALLPNIQNFSNLTPMNQSPFGAQPEQRDLTFQNAVVQQKEATLRLMNLPSQPRISEVKPLSYFQKTPRTNRERENSESDPAHNAFEQNKISLNFRKQVVRSNSDSTILNGKNDNILDSQSQDSILRQGEQGAQRPPGEELLPTNKISSTSIQRLPMISNQNIRSLLAPPLQKAKLSQHDRQDIKQLNNDIERSQKEAPLGLGVLKQNSSPATRLLTARLQTSQQVGDKRTFSRFQEIQESLDLKESEQAPTPCLKQPETTQTNFAMPGFSQLLLSKHSTSEFVKKREIKVIEASSPAQKSKGSSQKELKQKKQLSQQQIMNLKNRKTRGLGKKTLQRNEALKREMADVVLKPKEPGNDLTCKCSKSKCLQMYCICFTKGYFCDDRCTCTGCHNCEEHEEDIRLARQQIKQRDARAFQQRIIKQKGQQVLKIEIKGQSIRVEEGEAKTAHAVGCKCKNSRCQKKYCECFSNGIGCVPGRCKCKDCLNVVTK